MSILVLPLILYSTLLSHLFFIDVIVNLSLDLGGLSIPWLRSDNIFRLGVNISACFYRRLYIALPLGKLYAFACTEKAVLAILVNVKAVKHRY